MLLAGDERGHTQNGNNNTYCQDNELTWLNWEECPASEDLLEFTKKVIQLRKSQPVLQRRRFFHGRSIRDEHSLEIAWLDPDGKMMSEQTWNDPNVRCLGVHLSGGKVDTDEFGDPIIGDHLLILYNADHGHPIDFQLPVLESGEPWEVVFDTATGAEDAPTSESCYELNPCSVAVMRSRVKQVHVDVAEMEGERLNKTMVK